MDEQLLKDILKLPDTGAFRSSPDRLAVAIMEVELADGMVMLPSGVKITAYPMWDTKSAMAARLGSGPASAFLASIGMRLPTVKEMNELHLMSMFIPPVTFPTSAMLKQARVQMNSQAAINTFRTKHMMSHQWCALHDVTVLDLMEKALLRGSGSVSNFGKHWIEPVGTIYGWWKSRGLLDMIQTPSRFHAGDPTYCDYATTFHGVLLTDSVDYDTNQLSLMEGIPMATTMTIKRLLKRGLSGADVRWWQSRIGVDADGEFGPQTEKATRSAQVARGLVGDGLVGQRTVEAYGGRWEPVQSQHDPRAAACVAALRDANKAWPNRSRISDGIMGDMNHQWSPGPDGKLGTDDDVPRYSDHNLGNAVDITHDPANGADIQVIAKLAMCDPRTKYIIRDAEIWNPDISPNWRPYKGANKHTHHIHITVRTEHRDDSSPWPWAK